MIEDIDKLIAKFDVEGELESYKEIGEGHINVTYKVTMNSNGSHIDYVLQEINTNLFKDVDKLMKNIINVTDYLKEKEIKKGHVPSEYCIYIIKGINGSPYVVHNGKSYRMYNYVDNIESIQIADSAKDLYISGHAFGLFAKDLDSFDASMLYEILPDFHNTIVRYDNFLKALEEDKKGRKNSVKEEIDFVTARKDYSKIIVDLLNDKKMPLRVTHNDTKLNNILIDPNDKDRVVIIDLDTIMPGSICYDFGDSIRFGCNTSYEDETDLSKVNFNVEYFKAYTKGFLDSFGDHITQVELDNLVNGAIIMTYECGMRFLTDYLNGDTYFKISREHHNLDRARTQFKLILEMEKNIDLLNNIVKQEYEKCTKN